MLNAELIVRPPEFQWTPLIEALMMDCDRRHISPVRYLSSDGDQPRAYVPGHWRPNLLRGCQARQVYKVHGVPGDPATFDPRRQFRFDRGHVFEAWFIAYVKAMVGMFGISHVDTQHISHDPETGVGGKSDLLVVRNGYQYLFEVKSKEDERAFNAIVAPAPDHEEQLNDYMHMDQILAGGVIYVGVWIDEAGRTSIRFKEFFRYYDPALWAKTRSRVMMLEWFRDDPSKLAPKSSRPFLECVDCPYRVPCGAGLAPDAAKDFQRARGL